MECNIRKCYISQWQKNSLIKIMRAKEHLTSGRFSSKFTREDAQNEWQTIAKTLNGIPGAKKNWNQWRKTWHDIRTKTKKRQALLRSRIAKAGHDAHIKEELLDIDEEVLDPCSPVSEDTQHQESFVDFKIDNCQPVALEKISGPPQRTHEIELVNCDYQEQSCSNWTECPISGTSQKEGLIPHEIQDENPTNLAKVSHIHNKLKEAYYERKLNLLERKLQLKEEDLRLKRMFYQDVKDIKEVLVKHLASPPQKRPYNRRNI